MLHHVLLEVSDLDRSASFYDALLAPLGWRRHFDEDKTVGWGIAKPVFFVSANHEAKPGFGFFSFSAAGIVAVKAAWEGGVAGGGTSLGEPGERRCARLRLLLGVFEGPRWLRGRGYGWRLMWFAVTSGRIATS